MNPGDHPAPRTDYLELPTLTLVLPPGLGRDVILTGLAAAIAQVRLELAARMRQFEQLKKECGTAGEDPRQALCRGQGLAFAHAASHIDEAIVEAFDLWRQYEAQLSPADGSPPPRERQRPTRKPRGQHGGPTGGRPRRCGS